MERLVIGSPEHKHLLCRFFIDTHKPFKPSELRWPELDDSARRRLAALPIWNEAVYTEAETALKVQTLGTAEEDPLLAEAISLQGYEEGRHAEMLRILVDKYKIALEKRPDPVAPDNPDWEFMRVGYGECFDSFFAFGIFSIARDSGFFPPSLVDIFEPVMEEEGRHIIFHVNWVAYNQAQLSFARRPGYVFRRGLAMWLQIYRRLRTAMELQNADAGSDQDNFTQNAYKSFSDLTPRQFIETCIRENEKRLAPYDPRLLRPHFVPSIARSMLAVLPRDKSARAEVAA